MHRQAHQQPAATRHVGLYGGSFNPIHCGHLALARELLHRTALDEIWLMVSPLNPLKQQAADMLDDHVRLSLARLALQGEAHITASNYEFHLPRPSYTWNTLCALRGDFPSYRFTLLIGADNWALFPRWYRAADILSHHSVIVYPRRGWPVDAATLPSGVSLTDTPLYDISSTEVRRRAAAGLPVSGLVPAAIEQQVSRLYGPQPAP